MASDPADAITLWEAVKFLGPLVGTGGVTAILVAYFGSKRPKADDGASSRNASIGIQALLADRLAMERLTSEIGRVADGLEDGVKALNRACDLVDIAKAVERLTHKE